MTKPNFEIAVETRLIHQSLVKVKQGGEITYTALSDIVGYPVTGADSHLQSALRIALSNDDMVFENIRGEGYRRLTDEEIVTAAGRDTEAVRRKVKRSSKRLSSVTNFAALPPEKRVEHNARLSLFAAMTAMTKTSAVEQLKSTVTTVGTELPFAKTLEAFMGKKGSAR